MRNLIYGLGLLAFAPRLALSAPQCGSSDIFENRKPAIPFQPIPMVDPETGRPYHPNDPIKVDIDGKEQTFRAGDYFKGLNDIEERLSQWGYSIREHGEFSLSGWVQCIDVWEAQAKQIEKAIRQALAKHLLEADNWREVWDSVLDEYLENRPSWDEIYRLAEQGSYEVYMPEVAVFSATKPTIKRKPIEFEKEKSWPWEGGDKNKAYIGFFPYVKFGATKTEAKGEAGIDINGALAGQWDGSVAALKVSAHSPGSGPLTINMEASAVGMKPWTKPLAKSGSLSFEDEMRSGISHSVDFKFQLGPVPMRAEFGLRGELGLQYGLELYPLQIGSYVQPYAAADAYAQAGADAYVAAIGVGGQLRLIQFTLPIQGTANFEWDEEPLIRLVLSSTADLTLLSGDLYAYAKVNYLVGTWKGKHSFFNWKGFQKTGTIIDYKATYSRSGLIADGDLSPEDLLEQNYINRIAALEALEEQAASRSYETVVAVSKDLQTSQAMEVGRKVEVLTALSRSHDQAINSYYQELRQWLQ